MSMAASFAFKNSLCISYIKKKEIEILIDVCISYEILLNKYILLL